MVDQPDTRRKRRSTTPATTRSEAQTRPETLDGRRISLAILGLTLTAGLALRVWLSLTDDGIYWPDEIYQSVEPAHRLVFGYGLIAWEFKEGARNWLWPGVVAALLKTASVVGWDDPRAYLTFLRLALSALSLGAPIGTYLLARASGAGVVASATGAAIIALSAPVVFVSPRALSEVPSAVLVPVALALGLTPRASTRQRFVASSLLGLSVLVRLQNALFAAGFVALLAARRRWREALEASAILAAWLVALGTLDLITWGSWFSTVTNYIAFNLDPARTAIFDKAAGDYYVLVLLTSMGLLALAIVLLAPLGAARAPGLAAIAVGFVLVHSLIPHKELRFVLPALPLFASLVGLGVQHVLDRADAQPWMGRAVIAGVLLSALVSAATFRQLTFRDIGQTGRTYFERDGKARVINADASTFDEPGAVNRLLISASRERDLCGLRVEPMDLVYTGGYSYMHRNVPFYGRETSVDASRVNYVIVLGSPPPGDVRASENGFSLVRTRSSCASAAAGD